eukprot:g13857.t1
MKLTVLTKTLLNCPLCSDREPCLTGCKAGGRTWGACLEECLGDNPMMIDMFAHMEKKLTERQAEIRRAGKGTMKLEHGVTGVSSAGGGDGRPRRGKEKAFLAEKPSIAGNIKAGITTSAATALRGFGREL